MGLSSITAYSAGFIVLLFMITGAATIYIHEVEKAKETVREIKETDIGDLQIINTSYDKNTTTVWAVNKGSSPVKTSETDIYLDTEFIPRNSSNRSIRIAEAENPGLWDPGEKAKIEIKKHLPAGEHRIKISPAKRNNLKAESKFTSGITTNETLAVTSGEWEPPAGSTLTSSELLAINNKGGTNITLNDTNKTAGLTFDRPANLPAEVLSSIILTDYKAEKINDNEFVIEARYGAYDGPLLCNRSFGNTTGVATASINCSGITPSQLENIYIILNNTALNGRNITIDYVRVNTTYIYEN